jgi:aminoglycoside phosphotransferase (APT) family kinase protein
MALVNATDPQVAASSIATWWEQRNTGHTNVTVTDFRSPHSSGMSSETLLFTLTGNVDGQPTTAKLAARVMVPGSEVFPAYSLDAEAAAMRAVRASTAAPAPRVLAIEGDPSVVGGPFLLMEQLAGHTLGDDPPFTVAGWFCDLGDDQRATLFDNGLAALAQVHQTDTGGFPVVLGHPDRAAGTATAQHVAYWSDFYSFSREGKRNPVVEAAFAWLQEHAPGSEAGVGLVWGDARLGNMMFDIDQRVTAVLDWELLGLGPAEIDLGWFTFLNRMYTEGIGIDVPSGMPSVEETLSRYSSLAGRELVNFRYYEILAGARLAVVMMRLAHMLMAKGFMPPDNPMPITNPATVVLAGLLGIAQSGGETGWVSGHR